MYSNYDKLSYSMQKKTDKIIEVNKEMLNIRKDIFIPGSAFAVTSAYFLFSLQRYFNYVMPAFSESTASSTLKSFDLLVLVSCILLGGIFFLKFKSLKDKKDRYEKLRKDIINTINSDFCNCKMDCDCRDAYIKYMESEGIDLVF